MSGIGDYLSQVQIKDRFWSALRETVRKEAIPYQWKALNDAVENAEPSHCMRNFRIASGKLKGEHGGYIFQDSDVAKWLEGVAYSLTWHPDAELESIADGAIEEIVAAQQPDGYLDTYYIINGLEKRWTDLMDNHELYCAGHMIEAAVAYYQATGKRKLLDAMIRLVAHINSVIGPEENKIHGYPGHPVIEMALMRLYDVTKEPMHRALAEYFVRQRGQQPCFFTQEIEQNHLPYYWGNGPLGMRYYQAEKPLTEVDRAEGHAVRALYLYSGLADVARSTEATDLYAACDRLWHSVVDKQMYITGAVGSSSYGEAFTFDYDLPNDTNYGETCASIALVFLARRMLKHRVRGEYTDVMERALYNTIISGMQLDGKSFFYVNPLEVVPEATRLDEHKSHVKSQRQKWFGCSCCPPNIVRLLASLHQYIYSATADTLYAHLFVGGDAAFSLPGIQGRVSVETDYPWNGSVRWQFSLEHPSSYQFAIRIPGWSHAETITVNGEPVACERKDGYAYIRREWRSGDCVELTLDMSVMLYQANPLVREDAGQVAVVRGPVVYCLEECDNGAQLHQIRLNGLSSKDFEARFDPETLGGVVTLSSPAIRETGAWTALYSATESLECKPVTLRWIPYYRWANRGEGEMRVWVRR